MMKINFLIIIFSSIIISVDGQFNSKLTDIQESGIVYALPNTSFLVSITYTRCNYIKGPYADYAKSFLHISDIIREDRSEYFIDKLNVECFSQPGEFVSFIPEKGEINYDIIKELSNNKLIITDFQNSVVTITNTDIGTMYKRNEIYIPYESIYKDIIDTAFKREYRDSSWINVPYYNRKYVLKSKEDHARDAANVLIWLNEKKLKSAARLDPEENVTVDVSSSLMDETNNSIKYYTDLFTGKIITDTFKYQLIITPQPDKSEYTLFYFNSKEGISENGRADDKTELNIKSNFLNKDTMPKNLTLPETSSQFIYRFPVPAEIIISNKNKTYFKGIFNIAQYGKKTALPAKIVLHK